MKNRLTNQAAIDNFVMKYLVKSGKLKTLHAFEESLAKKQQATKTLSFVIERPPKRKLSDIEVNAKKPSKCMKKAIKGSKLYLLAQTIL